jgi:replicative DNA helicase
MINEPKNTVEVFDAPYNPNVEVQVLGSIITDKSGKLIKSIADTISPKHFHLEIHQKIFEAILYLHYNNVAVGYETLINRLTTTLKDGNADYIISLGGAIINDRNFENQVELLKDIYQKRVLYKLYLKRVSRDLSGIASVELVKEVESAITNMGISSNIENVNMHDYIDEWVKNLEDTTPPDVFETGFQELDNLVKIKKGKYIVIASRPGCGKSAFASKLVRSFCEQDKRPLFVSLEMGKDEFLDRVVSEITLVDHKKFDEKELLTSNDWAKILVAQKQMRNWKFEFNDDGSMKIEQLIGLAKYLKKHDRIDVLIVDYLQLLDSSQYKGQKQNQVENISRGFKQIAMSLEIPVIVLSQLNRASIDGAKIREPQLNDLRSSGAIEQDADIVMMLHTTDVENKYDERFITLFIRKNRQGKQGRTDFRFIGENLKFIETKKNWDTSTWEDVPFKDFNKENDIDDLLPF